MDFLPPAATLVAFSLASLVLAITPGPDMTLMLGRTLFQNKTAGFSVLAGTATGGFIHTVLAVIGLSALITASPTAFFALKVMGALYLLWLAYHAIFQGSGFALPKQKSSLKTMSANFLAGMGVNILNPKVILFFLTFLPQFVSATDAHAAQKMFVLGMLFNLIATSTSVAVILLADQITGALKSSPSIGRAIDCVFGTVFAAFAVRILIVQGN